MARVFVFFVSAANKNASGASKRKLVKQGFALRLEPVEVTGNAFHIFNSQALRHKVQSETSDALLRSLLSLPSFCANHVFAQKLVFVFGFWFTTTHKAPSEVSDGFTATDKLLSEVSDGFTATNKMLSEVSGGFTALDRALSEVSDGLPATDRALSEVSDGFTATDKRPSEASDALPATDKVPSEASDGFTATDKVLSDASDALPATDEVLSEASDGFTATDEVLSEASDGLPALDKVQSEGSDGLPATDKLLSETSDGLPATDKVLSEASDGLLRSLRSLPSFCANPVFAQKLALMFGSCFTATRQCNIQQVRASFVRKPKACYRVFFENSRMFGAQNKLVDNRRRERRKK